MTTTPSKQAQEAEAAARANAGSQNAPIPGGERDTALGLGDGDPQDPGGAQRAAPTGESGDQPRELPPTRGMFDDKRSSIIDRFRAERSAAPTEEEAPISDFARTGGMPQDFQEAAAGDEAQPQGDETGEQPGEQPQPPPQPQTFKVKVNGKEMDLTLEEMTRHAQIALASDNILDGAKAKLKEIAQLEADIRARAQRPGESGQHQPAQVTQPAEQPQQQPDVENQDDRLKRLVEEIQFGSNPDEAVAILRDTIGKAKLSPEEVARTVQAELQQQRFRDEGARAAKTLKEFRDQNPEIASDPLANAAIERKVYELQSEDLRALGLDPENLRQDGTQTTPADVAEAHKFYRANGMSVRTPSQLLEDGIKGYREWRGVKSPSADPQSEPQRGAPRIEVNRDARRSAIQQQPSRSAPARQPTAPAAQPRDRSAIVNAERARRAALRGQNLGV